MPDDSLKRPELTDVEFEALSFHLYFTVCEDSLTISLRSREYLCAFDSGFALDVPLS